MIKKVARMDVHLRDASLLASRMKYKDWTVRGLAQAVGVSKTTIGDLRSGERSYCQPDLAKRIAKVLDLAPEELFLTRISNVSREARGLEQKKAA